MTHLTSRTNVSASLLLAAVFGVGNALAPAPVEAQCSACMYSFLDRNLTCVDFIVGGEVCAVLSNRVCIQINECEWLMMLDIAEDGTAHSRAPQIVGTFAHAQQDLSGRAQGIPTGVGAGTTATRHPTKLSGGTAGPPRTCDGVLLRSYGSTSQYVATIASSHPLRRSPLILDL